VTVETSDDLAVFLADDFGRVVTYTKIGAAPVTLQGLFDSPTVEGVPWEQTPAMLQSVPRVAVRSADLPPDADEGDAVSVAGISTPWRVRSLLPDGTGLTLIHLEATA
jgi:hypothetical protein